MLPRDASPGGRSPGGAFYKAFALLVAAMCVGIGVLALLVTASGPRVRHVVVQNREGYGGVASTDQGLTLVFDRPVEGEDGRSLEEAVEIRPEADHTVSLRGQQLNVAFDRNLLSDTKYALTVGPALEDGTGTPMERAYGYEFSTAEPTFTYLERNYDPGAPDRVLVRAPLSGGASQALFEATQIESFARDDDHLAVVVPKTEYAHELRVVDLGTGEGEEVDVPGSVRIESLEFSPAGGQLAFVTRVVGGAGADESFAEGHDGRLYRYDVAGGGEALPVDTLGDEGDVEGVTYSRDGGALLYRTLDGAYYLTDAAGGSRTGPTPLGNHEGTGGFDRTNTKVVFRTEDGAAIYDARTRRLRKLLELPYVGDGGDITTPTFLHNSEELVFLESLLDPRTGGAVSQVSITDAAGEEVEGQIRSEPPTYFFDDPVVSHASR